MKLIYLLSFVLLFSTGAHAQTRVEEQIENKRKELRSSGVDITVSYYRYSRGIDKVIVDETNATCKPTDLRYLFWSKGKKSFVQRFDDCNLYLPVQIASSFMSLVKLQNKNLMNEKILPAQYKYVKKDTSFLVTTYPASHAPLTVFEINTGGNVIAKFIDGIPEKYVYLDGKHKNISYQHNRNSIQYKLKVLAEAIVKKISK